jgi:hypothetical protein
MSTIWLFVCITRTALTSSALALGTALVMPSYTGFASVPDDYAVTLPFSFRFYKTTYSKVYVSPNGFVSFQPLMNDQALQLPAVSANVRDKSASCTLDCLESASHPQAQPRSLRY